MMTQKMPTEIDFQKILDQLFAEALESKQSAITVKAGDFHRLVGGYPSNNHRMPICCSVMRRNMQNGDQILSSPPKGDGATLVIKYRIPREDA